MNSFSSIESLILKHAPRLMQQGIEREKKKAEQRANDKPWKYVTDEMRSDFVEMTKAGRSPTEIGEKWRVSEATVRTNLRKCGFLPEYKKRSSAWNSKVS